MPIVAALPAIAGIAGAGASIYSSVNNANAANAASKAQQNAASQAAANLQPWMGAGQSALAQEMALLGLGGGAGGYGGQPNWSAYVQNNPDVLAAFQNGNGKGATMDQFGQWHWNTFGQNENRSFTPYGQGGASGATGQQTAIDALKNSPLYQSLYHNGEQAVLANAAATGGLRGGNAERSLYNLGNDTLAQVYQNQINNLNNLSALGQNAAAGVGNSQLLGGQFAAGGILGGATANNNIANTVAGLPGLLGNSSFLNALGLGGGVKSPTTSFGALAPQESIVPNGSPQNLQLNTNIPVPVF